MDSFRFKPILLFALAALVAAGMFYAAAQKIARAPVPFSPETQIIPQGAAPRTVKDSLAAFGFSKPLPFFDEKNVVQSLTLGEPAAGSGTASSSPSSPTPYISYHVYGKDPSTIADAFNSYYKEIGWIPITTASHKKDVLYFRAPDTSKKLVRVLFIEEQKDDGSLSPSNVAVAISVLQ